MWIGQVRTPADVERKLNDVNFEKACPEHTVGGRKKVPWWNRELQNLHRQVNKALHYAYKTRHSEDWEDYKKVRCSFKRVLQRSKRERREGDMSIPSGNTLPCCQAIGLMS